MHSLTERPMADRRALQMIGVTLAALLVATTLVAAMVVHRSAGGGSFESSRGNLTERAG